MNSPLSRKIEKLREFNRIYTERLGFLRQKLDESRFSLSEARLLYELAQAEARTAADLAKALDLDPAQVSRTLKRFIAKGLVTVSADPNHGKQRLLSLTSEGRANFTTLECKTQAAIGRLLESLPPYRCFQIIAAAEAMSAALNHANVEVSLRDLRPGDLGLVISRQADLYAQEYGWNVDYEALVAGILADFVRSFDASLDSAWIADIDGQMVGSIFLVHSETAGVGKLRLLYVEPSARGMGIGQMLVSKCIVRAREAGYRRLDLWTNSVLSDARRIYERVGFRLVSEEAHRSFGQDLVGQTWSLALHRSQST